MPSVVILVVDDEEDIRDSVQQAIELSVPNARVLTAASGNEALELMGNEVVDAVISDFKMPGLTGIEFLKRARELSPNAPRVLMTAFSDESIAVDAINAARVKRFIRKPFTLAELVAAISEVIDEAKAQSQRHAAFARSLDALRRAQPDQKA